MVQSKQREMKYAIYTNANDKKVKKPSATEFIKKLKASGGYLMRKIKTADGKTMVYYREYGSYPTDIKTKIF